MAGNERTLDEHYQDDPERADATVFGRKTGVEPVAGSWAAADWRR